jgi:nucleoid DNA-binding protein
MAIAAAHKVKIRARSPWRIVIAPDEARGQQSSRMQSPSLSALRIAIAILDEIAAAARGNQVELRGFRAFSIKLSLLGRNPRTGGDNVRVEEKHSLLQRLASSRASGSTRGCKARP